MTDHEQSHEITQHLNALLNFITFSHLSGERSPGKRQELDAAITRYKDLIMSALENLQAAEANVVAMVAKHKTEKEADAAIIADLNAKLAAATAPTDTVHAVDVQKSVDGINAAIAS